MHKTLSALQTTALLILFLILAVGCKKFLDEKPDKALAIPSALNDLQALLDNNSFMNSYNNNALGEASADNYYLTYAAWSSFNFQVDKNVYIWEADVSSDRFPNDWAKLYRVVYYANTILEALETIERNVQNSGDWDNIKGSALFYRAQSFHSAVLLWSKTYDVNTAASDPGIPLRLNSDFNETSVRSSVQQTYEQIINDLRSSVPLLPATPKHVMRPSKPAAYALLSRVYLSMGLYNEAWLYADSALQLNNKLLNCNSFSASAAFPFPQFNDETLMYMVGANGALPQSKARIDSALYNSYSNNDLRKTLYFKSNGDGTYAYKGSYTANADMFVGLAIDELYLNKAECLARTGNTAQAMDVLNALLKTRWKTGTFVNCAAATPAEALQLVLAERRKELAFRDLRWMDIKRLNKEGANISITRNLNGKIYKLEPGDPRFVLAIPDYVIQLTGMQQNPR